MNVLIRNICVAGVTSCTLFIHSCGSDSNSVLRDSIKDDSVSVENMQKSTDSLPIEARLCGPMLDIANYIDSNGFSCDSTRLINVYTWLNDNEKIYGRGHRFYVCERSESVLGMTEMSEGSKVTAWFDSVCAAQNTPVIAYFFTDQGKNNFYNDGIVESWQFRDSAEARRAAEKLIFTDEVFGHNAPPAVCYSGSNMYVFYSRSTPGMYALLPFFREFRKRNNATLVAKENGWQ